MDNDQWERRRRELLHNFLENPGFKLSPIPEEDRSSSSDTGSLPDLIVEPERNRHDHSPEFYVGLEQRMKRLYRQLFLNENNSEDESCDLEVNRTSDTRKDNTMDTCATYEYDGDDTSHTINSINFTIDTIDDTEEDSSRSPCCHRTTTIADIHDSSKRCSVQFDNGGSPVLIPRMLQFGRTVFGSRLSGKQSNKPETDVRRLKDSEVTKIRMDSTFNTAVENISGTDQDQDAVDKSYEKNTEESFEAVEPIGHSTKNSINEDWEPVEMREARGSGDVSWHGDMEQTSSTLAFEAKSSQDKLEDVSVNSSEVNASIEEANEMSVKEDKSEKSINEDLEPVEEMREARGSGDVSWHGGDTEQTSSTLAFEAKSNPNTLEDVSFNSTDINASINEENNETNLEEHNYEYAKIIDDFWSASSVEVNSSRKKRRSDSSDADDAPPSKKKKDVATQVTSGFASGENLNWGRATTELFVGSPVVYRLCRCQNHTCS